MTAPSSSGPAGPAAGAGGALPPLSSVPPVGGGAPGGGDASDYADLAAEAALAQAGWVDNLVARTPGLAALFAAAKAPGAGEDLVATARAVAAKLNAAAEHAPVGRIRELGVEVELGRLRRRGEAEALRVNRYGDGGPTAPLTIPEMYEKYRGVAGETLVRKLLPRVGTCTTFGPSEEGKTTVTIYRILCTGWSLPFFGRASVSGVAWLYVGYEDSHNLHLRAVAQGAAMGLTPEQVAMTIMFVDAPRLHVASEESVSHFLDVQVPFAQAWAESNGMRLGGVTFDTQRHMISGGTSNEEATTSLVTHVLRAASVQFALLAEVIAHTPLADRTRQTGNTEQKGDRSTQLRVDEGSVWHDKARDMGKGRGGPMGRFRIEGRMVTELDGVTPYRDEDGEVIEAAVCVELSVAEAMVIAAEAEERDTDAITRRELLAALGVAPEPRGGAGGRASRVPVGWSDAQAARKIREVAKHEHEEGCPMVSREFQPWTSTPKISEALNLLAEEGLVSNRNPTARDGGAHEWLRTAKGAEALVAAGGTGCDCPRGK